MWGTLGSTGLMVAYFKSRTLAIRIGPGPKSSRTGPPASSILMSEEARLEVGAGRSFSNAGSCRTSAGRTVSDTFEDQLYGDIAIATSRLTPQARRIVPRFTSPAPRFRGRPGRCVGQSSRRSARRPGRGQPSDPAFGDPRSPDRLPCVADPGDMVAVLENGILHRVMRSCVSSAGWCGNSLTSTPQR